MTWPCSIFTTYRHCHHHILAFLLYIFFTLKSFRVHRELGIQVSFMEKNHCKSSVVMNDDSFNDKQDWYTTSRTIKKAIHYLLNANTEGKVRN